MVEKFLPEAKKNNNNEKTINSFKGIHRGADYHKCNEYASECLPSIRDVIMMRLVFEGWSQQLLDSKKNFRA